MLLAGPDAHFVAYRWGQMATNVSEPTATTKNFSTICQVDSCLGLTGNYLVAWPKTYLDTRETRFPVTDLYDVLVLSES